MDTSLMKKTSASIGASAAHLVLIKLLGRHNVRALVGVFEHMIAPFVDLRFASLLQISAGVNSIIQ